MILRDLSSRRASFPIDLSTTNNPHSRFFPKNKQNYYNGQKRPDTEKRQDRRGMNIPNEPQ